MWNCCGDCGVPSIGCDAIDVRYWYTCDPPYTTPTKHSQRCPECKTCIAGVCSENRPDGFDDCHRTGPAGCQRCIGGSCQDFNGIDFHGNLVCGAGGESCYCLNDVCQRCECYEQCDCEHSGCERHEDNDYSCYDFRPDLKNTCFYYDWCTSMSCANETVTPQFCYNADVPTCSDANKICHYTIPCPKVIV